MNRRSKAYHQAQIDGGRIGLSLLEEKYDKRVTTVLLKASRGPEPNRRSTRTVVKHLLDGGVVKPYL